MLTMTSTSNIGKYVNSVRCEENGGKDYWSIRSCAARADVSNAYWSQIESGKIQAPTPDILKKISMALKHPYENLLEAAGYLPSGFALVPTDFEETRRIPVISWVSANHFSECSDPYPVGVASGYIYKNVRGGKCMFALRVKGDCMSPEFRDGDIIVVDPDQQPENGEFAIVRDNQSDEATFKQIRKYGDRIILKPLNADYEEIELTEENGERFCIIGKVISKYKDY